ASLRHDAAPALARGREDARHRRPFRDAARALARTSRVPSPRARRMGQDRALQGERLYRGVAVRDACPGCCAARRILAAWCAADPGPMRYFAADEMGPRSASHHFMLRRVRDTRA